MTTTQTTDIKSMLIDAEMLIRHQVETFEMEYGITKSKQMNPRAYETLTKLRATIQNLPR